MSDYQEPLTGSQFWSIKHRTDDLVVQLGWTKTYAKQYIQFHYGCDSRLGMTDWQLINLLENLELMTSKVQAPIRAKKKSKRSKSRRK